MGEEIADVERKTGVRTKKGQDRSVGTGNRNRNDDTDVTVGKESQATKTEAK